MLTRERRRELKLEELYSEEPDYEMDGYESTIDRDDIFFGIRRHFHTTTRNFNASKLKAVYDELVDNGNVKTLAKFKTILMKYSLVSPWKSTIGRLISTRFSTCSIQS
ncbi:hypothetical protein Cantr_03552 [Candida viswanathii]|uniref:Uncharacterized protein n=1 Tax=Candida viswanathii TaxID=5486 RepID=A0A367YKY5_9ASCO|nr:hypothetical protein Cantr_03552 [Candida viswanathii]